MREIQKLKHIKAFGTLAKDVFPCSGSNEIEPRSGDNRSSLSLFHGSIWFEKKRENPTHTHTFFFCLWPGAKNVFSIVLQMSKTRQHSALVRITEGKTTTQSISFYRRRLKVIYILALARRLAVEMETVWRRRNRKLFKFLIVLFLFTIQ